MKKADKSRKSRQKTERAIKAETALNERAEKGIKKEEH